MHSYGGEGGRRIPQQDCNFHRDLYDKPWRSSMKPLDVVQVCGWVGACGWVGGWEGHCRGCTPSLGERRQQQLVCFLPGAQF